MSHPEHTAVDERFTATIEREANSGWPCAVMPRSGEVFGTRRPVRVSGTLDGTAFAATMLPIGDGTHMVPIKAALRKAIGKDLGDVVDVHITRRLG